MTLPIFTGDLSDRRAVLDYITDPSNAAHASLADQIAAVAAMLAAMPVDFGPVDAVPVAAKKGDKWFTWDYEQQFVCNESYTAFTANKEAKWTILKDGEALTALRLLSGQSTSGAASGAWIDNSMANLAAGGTVSATSKSIAHQYYAEMQARKTSIDIEAARYYLTGGSEYANWTAAYDSLAAYLTSTALFLDMGASTDVDEAEWSGAWSTARVAMAVIVSKLSAAVNSELVALRGNVTDVESTLSDMAADGVISAAEKQVLYREWSDIQNRRAIFASQAGDYSLAENAIYTTYVTDYNNLNTYLNTTLTLFSVMSISTKLTDKGTTRAEFSTKIQSLWASEHALDRLFDTHFETIIAANEAQIGDAISSITGITNNNVISGGTEKYALKRTWETITRENAELIYASNQYGVGVLAGYTAAFSALSAYLNTTLGVFTNMAADTVIDITVFTQKFTDYQTQAQAQNEAIATSIQEGFDENTSLIADAVASIEALSDDSIISGGSEKQTLKAQWDNIVTYHGNLIYMCASFNVVLLDAYNAAYNGLSSYLNTTIAIFQDMDTDTTINRADFNVAFSTYRTQYKAQNDVLVAAQIGLINTNNEQVTDALAAINGLSDDNIISGGSEKQTLKRQWDVITREHGELQYFAAKYSVTINTAYSTAYDDLSNYLLTTLDIFSDMSADTAVTRAVFNGKFTTFDAQFRAQNENIADAQAAAISSDPADYASFKSLIETIADDGIISAGAEKAKVIAIWLDIQAQHQEYIARAVRVGTETTALVQKYDELAAYLTGLADFLNENVATPVGATVFHQKFRTYSTAKAALESAIVTKLSEAIGDAARAVLDMNNDSVITAIEKASLKQEWVRYQSEKANLDAQCDAVGVVAEKSAMGAAYSAISSYLDSLHGGEGIFAHMDQPTELSDTQNDQWDSVWSAFITALTAAGTAVITAQQAAHQSLTTTVLLIDGTRGMSGDLNMTGGDSTPHYIYGLKERATASGEKYAATTGQVYVEQIARENADTAASAARIAADDALNTAMINADSAVTSAMTSAIDAEIANRIAAVSGVTTITNAALPKAGGIMVGALNLLNGVSIDFLDGFSASKFHVVYDAGMDQLRIFRGATLLFAISNNGTCYAKAFQVLT